MSYGISLWFARCTAAERKALQRVINTAQNVIGCPLLCLEDIYKTRCLRRAHSITRDSSHPGHHLLELLPSGRRFKTIKAKTNWKKIRLKNSFYPKTVIALNVVQNWTLELSNIWLQYTADCAIFLLNDCAIFLCFLFCRAICPVCFDLVFLSIE